MKDLFSIGELARYQNISKQTLIFYDKIGLFKPRYVDPNNGYRYYSASQIDFLDTILIMKKIGFSLDEIRDYMEHQNIENSYHMLQRQLHVIDAQLQELQLIRSRVRQRCTLLEQAQEQKPLLDVSIEQVQCQYILYEAVEAPYSPKDISIATKKCFSAALQKQVPIFFLTGVIVPKKRIQNGHYEQASFAFLPTEPCDRVSNIQELPKGTCVYTHHFGDYASIGTSYQRILSYCEKNKLHILSDAYEFCSNDYITSSDENEYITKIMFYIE